MLKSLPKGTHTFEFHLDKQFFVNMENTEVRDANVNVVLSVVYNGTFYDMTFKVSGTVTLLCDRCLDNLDVPVDTDYHVIVKYGESYDDSSDEMLVIPESNNYLNVAYLIYDTVMLAIPIKHVHPLGKCNRAMSVLLKKHRSQANDADSELENQLIDEMDDMDSGEPEQQSDPRWDALKKLQDNSDNN